MLRVSTIHRQKAIVWVFLTLHIPWKQGVCHKRIERFSEHDATSTMTWKWRENCVATSMYGNMTAFLRHFHVLAASCLLNLSIIHLALLVNEAIPRVYIKPRCDSIWSDFRSPLIKNLDWIVERLSEKLNAIRLAFNSLTKTRVANENVSDF